MRKRVLAGILITLLIFVVARRISRNRSSEAVMTFDDVRIVHTTVYEQIVPGRPEITLHVSPPAPLDAQVLYRRPGGGTLDSVAMSEKSGGVWSAMLPAMEKGGRLEYGFRVSMTGETAGGGSSASAIESGFHLIKYKGEVSATVLILHILCMFAAFFFMVESFIGATAMIKSQETREFTVAQVRWALLFTFLGGWPLGFVLNWQRFGVVWEGFPFGYDVTDNKTQLITVFWLIVALMSWKSFACRRSCRDLAGDRVFALAVMTAAVLSFLLYLVPHSL